jgi:cubilin
MFLFLLISVVFMRISSPLSKASNTAMIYAFVAGCGGLLHTKGSTFTSPKYPGKYPPNSECTWDIQVKEGYFVSLSFLERFDIEQSTECSQDFVQVLCHCYT